MKGNMKLVLLLLSVVFFTGCLSRGVTSTGANLPSGLNEMGNDFVKVSLEHNCSKMRCTSVTAEIENVSESEVEILPQNSRITRAGESLALKKMNEGPLKIKPGQSVEMEFAPTAKGKTFSYFLPDSVWCSLKVDSECKIEPKKAQTECAAFVRYYHETYKKTGGWITVNLAYKSPLGVESVQNSAPTFFGEEPSIELTKNSDAPSWYGTTDDAIFYKIECDDKCHCKEVAKKRNFFTDDKFFQLD